MIPEQSTCITLLLLPLILTSWTCLNTCHADPQNPQVHLGHSVITGLFSTVSGNKPVMSFLGIRYGQAPTGYRRFQPPVKAELPRTVDARQYGARCPQGSKLKRRMSEDCLFLNVFVPGGGTGQHPVLVWLHDGGFITGSADVYQAEELAGEGGVIVVTLNYRLGALGFLSTGDDSSRGNYGLWDQRLALQWVRDNIEHFGGNKARVTLAGSSAGAACVSFHALSSLSRGLFSHVMMMSGSATAPWARETSSAAVEAVRALGLAVGCQSRDHHVSTTSLVTCLRQQSVNAILNASEVLFPDKVGFSLVDFGWGPVEDGTLVREVTKSTPFTGPLLAGLVNNEGDVLFGWTARRVFGHIPDAQTLLTDREFYSRQFLPTLLKQTYPEMVPLPWPTRQAHQASFQQPPFLQALQKVQNAYRREGEEEGRVGVKEVKEVYGDQGFVLGTVRFLEQCSRGNRHRFLYFVDYQTKRPGIDGFRHLDDMVFLFGFNTTLTRKYVRFDGHVTESDLKLSRDLRQMFVNFIKNGNPNHPKTPQGWPLWKPYTADGASYLHLSPSPRVLSHLKADKMALWLKEIPEVLSSADGITGK